MGPAPDQPRLGGSPEIRLRLPHGARHGEPRQRLAGDDVDGVGNDPESVAQVDQRCHEGGPRPGVEDEADGIRLAADRQLMDLAPGLARGNRRANLEHVGS
jgi:hypothetical protein